MFKKHVDLFIGCYGSEKEETIHWLNFDVQTGRLSKKYAFTGIENPSFLTVDKNKSHLYAISETANGEVVSYRIKENQGIIDELNRVPTKGGPCYLEIDENDHTLYTANYGNGSVIVHSLKETGEIGNEISFYQSFSEQSDSKMHAIRKIPHTSYYIATDLGLNKLCFFKYDQSTGKFIFLFDEKVPDGSGPRHIAFHPTLEVFYIVNEFNSTILTYSYDKKLNVKLCQVLPTIADDFQHENYGADIHVTMSGKFVYASNRGHDSITAYKVLDNGTLSFISCTETGGKWPRNFSVLPEDEHILVANEHSNSITVLKILTDGSLERTSHQYNINRPVCIHVAG